MKHVFNGQTGCVLCLYVVVFFFSDVLSDVFIAVIPLSQRDTETEEWEFLNKKKNKLQVNKPQLKSPRACLFENINVII